MARVEYKNLSIKMDKTIHKGFERWLKAVNKGKNKNKVYKVRVIEDLLFIALCDLGFVGGGCDSDFSVKYRKDMNKRQYYHISRPNFKKDSKTGRVMRNTDF